MNRKKEQSTLVMKFGGSSLEKPEAFVHIAKIIQARSLIFSNIVVVVSAMGNTTNRLEQLACTVSKSPSKREFDMLLSCGERISIALLSMALADLHIKAISFTGSQSGIITCNKHGQARICDVRPIRIIQALKDQKIGIIAGFQGVSQEKEITTLGRGGSDTTAVALAIALKADKVEFYKDVEGIYEKDPKKHPKARFFLDMDYDQAIEAALQGGVLHPRSLILAKKNKIFLHLLSYRYFDPHQVEKRGTKIRSTKAYKPPSYLYEEEVLCMV